jgi:hypothetical protein
MNDSLFCRRCGTKRPKIEEDTGNAGKRYKKGGLEDKIKIVADASYKCKNRSDACCTMLYNMVPGSLGDPLFSRTHYQKEYSELVGISLKQHEAALSLEVSDLEKKLEGPTAKKVLADGKLVDCQNAEKAVRDQFHAKEAEIQNAKVALEKKMSELGEATKQRNIAQNEMNAASAALKEIEDLYNNNFVPLKRCSFSTTREAHNHVNNLCPHFKKWGGPDCLIAGFEKAGPNTTRPAFCNVVMTECEKLFTKPRSEALERKAAAQEALEKAEANLALKKKAVQEAEQHMENLRKELQELTTLLEAAKGETQKAVLAATEAAEALRVAEAALAVKKMELRDFKDGPLKIYEELKIHEERGYKHDSFPKKEAKAKEDNRNKKCVEMKSELGFANLQPTTKDMLSDSVPGAYGAKKELRDDLQKKATALIKAALGERLQLLIKKIEDQFPKIGGTDVNPPGGPLNALKDKEQGPPVAQEIVDEKKKALDSAKDLIRELTVSKDKAQQDKDRAQSELMVATKEKNEIVSAYEKHFLPLKKGKCTPAEVKEHLHVLVPLLQIWKVEDCLVEGFKAAAIKCQEARGVWCGKVIDEIEKIFIEHRTAAEAKEKSCAAALEKASKILANYLAKLKAATDDGSRKQGDYDEALKLQVMVNEHSTVAKRIDAILDYLGL